MFILQYEGAVVSWLTEALPSLTQAIYSDDISRLTASSDAIRYPAVVFWRDSGDQILPQAYDIYEEGPSSVQQGLSRGRFFTLPLRYTARLVCEKQSDAWKFLRLLRNWWADHSYVYVRLPDYSTDFVLKVGMKLLSMHVLSERDNLDLKGAQRVVEFSWSSQLAVDVFDGGYPMWDSYTLCVVAKDSVTTEHVTMIPAGGSCPSASAYVMVTPLEQEGEKID